ncbi:MAG TPA: hypothetical protein VEF36_15925 [Roseiarcus sp.]|nr:hypothetical protein [Roseiarcus sp.]
MIKPMTTQILLDFIHRGLMPGSPGEQIVIVGAGAGVPILRD